ncbi:MAG: PEP-CTERM sorting domain-containing protein [Calothrix sp. MO_192.B10]|nr:PEP-CTERM sorting domain-containing protein [Calothrix sp. MO_192.B10]
MKVSSFFCFTKKSAPTLITSCILATGGALVSSGLLSANAASISGSVSPFTGDPAKVDLLVQDITGGVQVTATVDQSVSIADIRGIWFDISDNSLVGSLSIAGSDVTQVQQIVNGVNNLGGGANLNGGGTFAPYDVGVEIGTPGIGANDIQSTMFTVLGAGVNTSLFASENFGVRLTSVGAVGSSRSGSSKLQGTLPTTPPPTPVPEPFTILGTAVVLGFGVACVHQNSLKGRKKTAKA